MNRLITVIILVFTFIQLKSQSIEIGQSAYEIKRLVEWSTKNHNKPDSYGNYSSSRANWDVSYNNGQIFEVLQCMKNQYYIDLGMSVDFCKHYIIKNNKLAYILTEYENISIEDLISSYDKFHKNTKVGDFYFDEDFEHFSIIFLANNRHTTVEWKKTDITTLSTSMLNKIKLKKEIISKRKLDRETELQRKKIYTSKEYELLDYRPNMYIELENKFREKILDYLASSENPDFKSSDAIPIPKYWKLQGRILEKYRYSKSFIAHCKTNNHFREDYVDSSSSGKLRLRKTTCISGCDGFNGFRNLISWVGVYPEIQIEGYKVNSKADIKIQIDYAKGVSRIKIKKGYFEFIENNPYKDLESKIRLKIEENITGLKGRFFVKYEYYNIMGSTNINVIIEK